MGTRKFAFLQIFLMGGRKAYEITDKKFLAGEIRQSSLLYIYMHVLEL